MKWLRGVLAALALVGSLAILSVYSGIGGMSCTQGCAAVHSLSISWPLAVIGPILAGAQVWSAFSRPDAFIIISRVAAGGGLALIIAMFALRQVCEWCLFVDLMLVCQGFTTFRGMSVVAAVLGIGALVILAPSAFQKSEPPHVVHFSARTFEGLTRSDWNRPWLVVFSDPECPHCKALYEQVEELRKEGVMVFYRWYILPQDSDTSVKASALVEALSSTDPEGALKLRTAMYATHQNLTPETLTTLARNLGLREDIQGMLENPPTTALATLAADGAVAKDLNVSAVPSLYLIQKLPNGQTSYLHTTIDDVRATLRVAHLPGGNK